jgi:S-formylglutathione hydrolase FrmB
VIRSIRFLRSVLAAAVFLSLIGTASAQNAGRLEQISVFGPSLEGNLEGSNSTRDVFVYLPPSYSQESARRYPVLYFLHGYSVGADAYVGLLDLPAAMNQAIADGEREMIVVLPDANSRYSGSMYSNSPTIGDWESYIARDLVAYIDKNYRTVAERGSRGLAGHSMGGYGTLRIGMKHSEVFGALFAMSSCCLFNAAPNREAVEAQIARTADGPPQGGGFANALLAQAAAWSPDPGNPPLYIEWPYRDGEAQPIVQARWAANSPLVFVDQHVPALRSFRAISIDVGDADGLMPANVQLDEALDRLGVEHEFEIYEGDHGNRVASRFIENVLPFFAMHLD